MQRTQVLVQTMEVYLCSKSSTDDESQPGIRLRIMQKNHRKRAYYYSNKELKNKEKKVTA
jgi:hypothetical protein